jgi:hypothetical protein
MEVRTTILPGQKGTRQLLRKYGNQLVCVRYRYDKERKKRYKTVELIVDEKDWEPGVNYPSERQVLIRVGYGEVELREQVKVAGGFWNPERKAWSLSYRKVRELGLERRVVGEEAGL